jgi:predicted regulator of Ras-like GTPase activity (Roadblock/LC7/MglB family)
MMATASVGAVVKDLRARVSGLATALVSRDGQVLCADLPEGRYTETFAIMCATVFGAAATASQELDRAPPERILIEGEDSRTVLVACGRTAVLVAVIDASANLAMALGEVTKFADLLRSS